MNWRLDFAGIKLYIIKDYQRLKKDEVDILNMALFGKQQHNGEMQKK